MMGQAQEKANRLHLKNVTFQQGDVGTLPFTDGEFDIVLSLNGFHAFPDKEAAYREVFRVLRPGGTFCGCFYVADEHKRTDWFVRHIYEKAGFFTPPYETVSSLKKRLEHMYTAVTLENVKGIAWFVCRKEAKTETENEEQKETKAMKILVYGAGVLGCNLARNLLRAGKDVTLLARGNWAAEIKQNGLRIKDKFSLAPRSAVFRW